MKKFKIGDLVRRRYDHTRPETFDFRYTPAPLGIVTEKTQHPAMAGLCWLNVEYFADVPAELLTSDELELAQ